MAFVGAVLRTSGACAQTVFPHDLAVTNLYTLDKLAQADAVPHTVRARVLNRGQQPVANALVRLHVRGANALGRTATVSLAPGQAAVVAFAPYLPGTLGRQRLSVRVPADDNPANDSLALGQVVSPDTTSYITPGVPTFDAFPGGSPWVLVSALGNRFSVGNTPRLVRAVRAYVTDTVTVGQEVVGFAADPATGRILSRSAPRILTRADIDRIMTFRLLDDLVLQNQDYLAGFSVLGRPGPPVRNERYPYGYQFEVPYRTRAFYDLWPLYFMSVGDTPPLPPTDVSVPSGPNTPDTLSGKPMVEVVTAAPPACARPANLHVVVRGGPFRVAFDSTYNAAGYEVAYGPAGFDPNRAAATGGQVVAQRRGPFVLAAAQPNVYYTFYVRSQCAGATGRSGWVGPVGATSPCQNAGVFQFPYREAFDALPPGQPLPCGTEVLDNDRNRSSWVVQSGLQIHTGQPPYALYQSPPNALYLNLAETEYPVSGAADDWFFTPPLALQATHRYHLSFSYQNLGSPLGQENDRLAVWLGDAPDPARQTTLLFRDPQINFSPYRLANAGSTPAVQAVTVPADGLYHLGFQAYSRHLPIPTNCGYRLLLDNLELADEGPLPTRAAAAAQALRLYPNPAADGRFTLEMPRNPGDGPAAVRVTDALGRVVVVATLPATGRLSLDLSQQLAGLYVVQVCTAAGCVTRKLVVGL